MKIDLLNLVEQGGCSAKLSATDLQKALANLPQITDKNVLVDINTHDDAGVYRVRDDYAIIQTTDFFPPVCSDPYDFGQVAAANALSDIYAMGGQVLTALNLVLFPAHITMEILKQILRGGQDKVKEAGGVIIGGHTIADEIPKYGLAVTGWIHPDKIITNDKLVPGETLILTKPLGTGSIISAKKNDLATDKTYNAAISNMKLLNAKGAEIMNNYQVKSATDITGFGLLGHAKKMADGSKVSIEVFSDAVPAIENVIDLIDLGCIPGAAFRNKEYCDADIEFSNSVHYNHKMLLYDAQTSGGLLISAENDKTTDILNDLKKNGYPDASIIGKVIERQQKSIYVI